MNKVLDMPSSFSEEGFQFTLQEKLSWFIFLRIGVISSLLAFFIFFKLKSYVPSLSQPLISVYFLLALTYLINFFFVVSLQRIKNLEIYVGAQIVYDIVFTTALLWFLQAPDSIYNILYAMAIIFASLLFQRTGALLAACFCTICFSLLVMSYPFIESQNRLLVLFLNNSIFYIVALASGTVADQLRITGIKLKEKESFTETILDNISSGLLTVDMQNRIVYFNKAAVDITNTPRETVLNQKLKNIFPEFHEFLKEDNNERGRPEIMFEKDGEKLYLGAVASRLKDHQDSTTGHILIFQDLTKLKKMEEEVRISDKLAAVGKLAAGIAHEIRNPLASMSGSIQVLQRTLPLDEDDKKLMNIILKETERLNSLITEFLTFVRPSAIHKKTVFLSKIMDEILQTVKINPKFQKNIHISLEGEEVEGFFDPEKFKQIFWNLLLNSCEAMPEGGDIRISWKKKNNKSLIKISDTGEGIAPEIREKIFDPFFTTKEGGTGLGLATVYKIIEAHGGHIHVESEKGKGKGTTFTIEL